MCCSIDSTTRLEEVPLKSPDLYVKVFVEDQ